MACCCNVDEGQDTVPNVVEKMPEAKPEKPVEPPTVILHEAPTEFTVKLKKEAAKLGFVVETLTEHCVCKKIESYSPAALQIVRPFDRLVRVNGRSGTGPQLAKLVFDNEQLELEFQRPVMKEITLEKKGRKAGFRIEKPSETKNTHGLVIKGIDAGGATSDLPEGTFNAMDRISAIDGQEGTSAELLDMLMAKERMVITLCRYA